MLTWYMWYMGIEHKRDREIEIIEGSADESIQNTTSVLERLIFFFPAQIIVTSLQREGRRAYPPWGGEPDVHRQRDET